MNLKIKKNISETVFTKIHENIVLVFLFNQNEIFVSIVELTYKKGMRLYT